jgi:hypothetical protein
MGKGCAFATSSAMAGMALRAVRLCQSGDPQEVTVCIWRLFSQQKGMHVARPQQAEPAKWAKSGDFVSKLTPSQRKLSNMHQPTS